MGRRIALEERDTKTACPHAKVEQDDGLAAAGAA